MSLNLSKLSDAELVELGRDTYGLTNAADMARTQLEESITSIHHGGETPLSKSQPKPTADLTPAEKEKREAKNARRRAARAAKKAV